jgi:hypothetical protein
MERGMHHRGVKRKFYLMHVACRFAHKKDIRLSSLSMLLCLQACQNAKDCSTTSHCDGNIFKVYDVSGLGLTSMFRRSSITLLVLLLVTEARVFES